MAARSTPQTPRSTPTLSEAARHLILPSGIVSTGWAAVSAVITALGIVFDVWQVGASKAILGKRADGQYAADAVVISIPRQVGKTFLLGAIVFALCIINPGLLVIWTAHHTRTSDETFADLRALASLPKAAKHVKVIRAANGQQGIEFHNGSRILFGAREQGFGRGFKKVGVLVLDEGQILTESAMDNLVPTTNQADNPLILLAGTPPRPKDPSEVFTNLRTEALAAGSGKSDTFYLEFSADADADPLDRAQWAKANPSFPKRTKVRAILRMLKHLGMASFRREALGIWDATSRAIPAIDPATFALRKVDKAPEGDQVSYGVKFSPDGSRMAISVALATDDGPFVEVVDSASTSVGISGLTDWLVERWQSCDAIVIDGKGAAGTLNEALIDAGVSHRKIIRPTFDWVVTANSSLVEKSLKGGLSHTGQPGLIHAVANTSRKDRGETGGWTFTPITEGTDVTALQSVALAMHGLGGVRRRNGKKSGTRGRMVTG